MPANIGIGDIDWSATFASSSAEIGHQKGTLYKVQFKDGTVFESFNSIIFLHCSADTVFAGPWGDREVSSWSTTNSVPKYAWQQLADRLTSTLISTLHLDEDAFAKYKPRLYVKGINGVNRCVVRWCNSNEISPDRGYAIAVEFDLESGAISLIRIEAIELLTSSRYGR